LENREVNGDFRALQEGENAEQKKLVWRTIQQHFVQDTGKYLIAL
jgi:hypothetical protein